MRFTVGRRNVSWLALTIVLFLAQTVLCDVTFNPPEESGLSISLGFGRQGSIRVAYDPTAPCIDTVVYLGVGTAMGVENYSELSRQMVALSPSTAVVAADHRARFFLKHSYFGSSARISLTRLANHVHDNLGDYVHQVCTSEGDAEAEAATTTFPLMILGGHSASGIPVLEALQYPDAFTFTPAGFVALDVFLQRIPGFAGTAYSDFALTNIPSVIWGMSENTCMVVQERGSQLAYRQADAAQRVLYQVVRNQTRTGHCDFTNAGCGNAICGLSATAGSVLQATAESAYLLIRVVTEASVDFTRENMQLTLDDDETVMINTFFGADELP